jgi:hypothetical protein
MPIAATGQMQPLRVPSTRFDQLNPQLKVGVTCYHLTAYKLVWGSVSYNLVKGWNLPMLGVDDHGVQAVFISIQCLHTLPIFP